ncbi:hypothetical protein [Streptomyces xanthophaeus]|uniref:hypothetical protein n=1 Tax=Streptomyces xanthophaeus TaxID=67385 RepID=UPI0012FEFAC1|nr:hypothetical protein [Streptomyces xanthophaeus]
MRLPASSGVPARLPASVGGLAPLPVAAGVPVRLPVAAGGSAWLPAPASGPVRLPVLVRVPAQPSGSAPLSVPTRTAEESRP